MRSRQEEQYLLKAVDAFQRRMIVVSPDFTILAANSPNGDLSIEEMVGRHCFEVFSQRDSPCLNCAVEEVLHRGKPILMPKPDDTLDLGRIPCYYAYPIPSGDDVEAFVSMDFDLPSVGALEEKMRKSNALLRNFIHSAVDGVIAADMKGRIVLFNEAAVQVFGHSVQEALNTLNIRDIYPERKELEVMKRLRSDAYGGSGKLESFMVDVVTRAGERIPIRLNAAIVYDKGREVATIGFFHDLRERQRMEQELKNTQLQLLQAEKMASLGKLAAGVAHQLNNPLGGITLFAKLIMEEYELEQGVRDDLDRILKDAERCRDTVRELLEFTRQTRHFMRPHDVNRAITRTLFLLENQTLFHNITIERDLSDDLPMVPGDIQQLNHLFMNIVLNAAQAMAGKGRLRIRTRQASNGRAVRIEIADTGPGISPQDLPLIFDPFFTTKDEGEGTGLGLSLVYGIVENHHGSIRAVNNPDGGAAFIIELPLKNKANGDAAREK